MATPDHTPVREQLLDRRQRLETALRAVDDPQPLRGLLRDVDAALERIEAGSFGLCSVCHEAIEADRLEADPLLRNCIDHLTAAEQRALEQDLDLSSRVQADLLPARELAHDGWELAYHYEPLGAVSGDYCDVQTVDHGGLLVLVGDVVGKGVSASLLMTHLHAIFRSLATLDLPLADLVGRANRIFSESTGCRRFATLACARAGREGALEVCNAGHCPPLHVSARGVASVPAGGLPVGLFGATPYTTTTLCLAPGDVLLLYTDGVSESRDRDGNEFGAEGITRAVLSRRTRRPLEIVQGSLDDLVAFRAGTPRRDDLTLLVLRRSH
jgi:sigma-B regulation protein RsbU (phosphoserine phosphatase)